MNNVATPEDALKRHLEMTEKLKQNTGITNTLNSDENGTDTQELN